jgi:DNA-binding transcriptional regulator YdaS (Cro superfamily)
MDEIIDKACEAAGGLTKLAEAIGQSTQTVSNWRSRGVPVVHCAAIEQATGGKVTRRDLRPDDWARIWPELAEPTKAAA